MNIVRVLLRKQCNQSVFNDFTNTHTRTYKRWVSPTLKEIHVRKRRHNLLDIKPKRSTFLEWNYDAEIFAFAKRLRENFDLNALKVAFIDRSYVHDQERLQREAGIEKPEVNVVDNKELQETGGQFMREYLDRFLAKQFAKFPKAGRDCVREYLTSEAVLAEVSSMIGTTDIVLTAEFPVDKSTLANTLNAIIGALLQSSGPDRTENFIKDLILTQLNGKDVNELWRFEHPMDLLNEYLTREKRARAEARLVSETGRNTLLAAYQVAVYSDRKYLGLGNGETIETATDQAARDALKSIFETVDHMPPIDFNVPATLEERISRNSV